MAEITQVKEILDLSKLATITGSEGVLIQSSTLSGKPLAYVNIEDLYNYIQTKIAKNIDNHDIPRKTPKDITSYYNDDTLWNRIAGSGGFALKEDIYVGDYFKMKNGAISAYEKTGQYQTTGSDYVTIAGISTLKGNSDSIDMNYEHLVMVPGKGFGGIQHFGRARMNPNNVTTGGYGGSEMNTEIIGPVVSATATGSNLSINQQLYNEFGSHLKTTRELLSNSVNTEGYNRFGNAGGCSNGWNWYSCQAVLMSEIECYGSVIWGSSGRDIGTANHQLPLFFFNNMAKNNRTSYYWLKDVASSIYFCRAHNDGHSGYYHASAADIFVRPRFVIA